MATRSRACSCQTLARGRHCQVEQCSHGTVHLRFGALSLRLSEAQFASVADTLFEARSELVGAEAAAPPGVRLC